MKLNHSLLYDDDTPTHAAYDMKSTFRIVGSKTLDGRSWSYFDTERCTVSTLKRYNHYTYVEDWLYFLHYVNDFWRIHTDFRVKISQVKVKLRV